MDAGRAQLDTDPAEEDGEGGPIINAPWAVTGLIAGLALAHALRLLAGWDVGLLALTSQDLHAGRLSGLITHIFVHGSWAHLLMNGAFVLAFGAPVARFLGPGRWGALGFIVFFLLCGVLAALGYALIKDASGLFGARAAGDWALVGASGAASGLMGAAVRLIQGGGALGPVTGSTTLAMSAAWVGLNVVFGLTGLAPETGGAPVAWEVHILGYFLGMALIGPFGWMTRDHALAP